MTHPRRSPLKRNEGRFVLSIEAARLLFGRLPHFAADDESRPILTGIQVQADGQGIVGAAADGFVLGVQQVPGRSVGKQRAIVVDARFATQVARRLPKRYDPAAAFVWLTHDGFTVTVEIAGDGADGDRSFDSSLLIQGTYPDWVKLIPKWRVAASAGAIALAPSLLARIANAVKVDKDSYVTRWYYRSISEPAVCIATSEVKEMMFLAVVMPMFVTFDGLTAHRKTNGVLKPQTAERQYRGFIERAVGGLRRQAVPA